MTFAVAVASTELELDFALVRVPVLAPKHALELVVDADDVDALLSWLPSGLRAVPAVVAVAGVD